MRARASQELAAQFAARLESALRGDAAPAAASGDEQAVLVPVAVALRDAAAPLAGVAPRPGFRAALAERLAEEAGELGQARRAAAARGGPRRRFGGARTDPGRPHRPRRVRGVLAGAVALAVAGGAGAAVASEDALPGGALYPLKRQVEDLRLQLSSSDEARGTTELALARERLVEAERLAVAAGGADVPAADSPELRGALEDFRSSAAAGIEALTDHYARTGEATSLAAVDTFLDETPPVLERLRSATPPSVHPVVDDLLDVLGASRLELADTVAGCAQCADLGVVVTVPTTTPTTDAADPTSTPTPAGTATLAPGSPTTAPTGGAGGGAGGGGGDDPGVDPLPSDPGSVVEDVLPPLPTAPSGTAPSVTTTTEPPAPLPTVSASITASVPPVLPTDCTLPVGCP